MEKAESPMAGGGGRGGGGGERGAPQSQALSSSVGPDGRVMLIFDLRVCVKENDSFTGSASEYEFLILG